MDLKEYFKKPSNSISREETVNYKLFHELKIAAAKRGYHLQIYTPPIDQSGFDCILDDGETIKKIQIKTVSGKANNWEIHANLLKPSPFFVEAMGFQPTHSGMGQEGGVLLLEIIIDKEMLNFNYLYFDCFILNLFKLGIIQKKYFKTREASELINKLEQCRLTDKIELKKSCFIKLKSVDAFLAISGLHSTMGNNIIDYSTRLWKNSETIRILRNKNNNKEALYFMASLRTISIRELSEGFDWENKRMILENQNELLKREILKNLRELTKDIN